MRTAVELTMTADALEMSRPAVKETFGATVLLNSKPAGAFNINVTFVPTEKSVFLCSVITIGPSVAHAGDELLPALLDKRPVPPVARVIRTPPWATIVQNNVKNR